MKRKLKTLQITFDVSFDNNIVNFDADEHLAIQFIDQLKMNGINAKLMVNRTLI